MSDELPQGLHHDLNYNNTSYERYITHNYQIVCMGGVSIDSIESVTVPLLRQVYPHNPIVFVYGGEQSEDYQFYISKKYGSQYYRMVDGNADVDAGYALSSLNHVNVQHERAHLEMCAAHGENSDPYDPSTWIRTANKPWCSLHNNNHH